MWDSSKHGDIEAGSNRLYPAMQESPQMRWAFIRKVYTILTIQFLMTLAVSFVVVTVRPISDFFAYTRAGLVAYICISVFSFIVLLLLYFFYQKHPLNLLLLAVFTVAISFEIGLACAFASGKAVLEAVILTTVIVVSLTIYTFWAAKRGYDFQFLGPFLFAALMMLMVFSLIQIFFPLGKPSKMIFGAIAALIFSGYIVFDTDSLIKRYSYDEYIIAAVSLYLDIVNLFLALLQLFDAIDG